MFLVRPLMPGVDADPQRASVALLPATLLLMMVVAFAVAREHLDLWLTYFFQVFCLFLLPFVWFWWLPKARRLSGVQAWWWALALGQLAWLGLVNASRRDLPMVAWNQWMTDCAAAATAIFVTVAAPNARALVAVLGAAASAALLVAACGEQFKIDWLGWYGAGNVNFLVNVAGPSLLAWLVMVAAEWRLEGRRPSWREASIIGLGLVLVVLYAVKMQRRGLTLDFLVLGPGCLLWLRLRRTRPRLARLLLIPPLLIGVAVAVWVCVQDRILTNLHHVNIWRSAVGAIPDALPFGLGNHGCLAIQWSEHEWARRYVQTGHWSHHVHNDFLEAVLDGGPIGLVLLIGMCWLWWRRVCASSDPVLRLALPCLGLAVFLHMNTDVVYGTAVGKAFWYLAGATGLLAPMAEGGVRSWTFRLPPARWLYWPLLGVAGCGAALGSAAAFMRCDASVGVRWKVLHRSTPLLGVSEMGVFFQKHVAEHDGLVIARWRRPAEEVYQALVWQLGPSNNNLNVGVMAAILERNRWRFRLKQRPEDPEAGSRLEAGRRLLAERVATQAHRFPISFPVYRLCALVLQDDPELRRFLPARVVYRTERMLGQKELPTPDLSARPTQVDDLADFLADVNWAIINDMPWSDLSAPLAYLGRYYADNRSIAGFLFRALSQAGPQTMPWAVEALDVTRFGEELVGEMRRIGKPEHARNLLPFLRAKFPDFFARFERHQLPIDFSEAWRYRATMQICRLVSISRLAEQDLSAPSAKAKDPLDLLNTSLDSSVNLGPNALGP